MERVLWARQQGDGSEADERQNTSASSVVTPIVVNGVIAIAFISCFLILRKMFPRIYRPRSFLGSLRRNERSPDLPTTLFSWIPDFYRIPDTYIMQHHSLDAYLFLRFLKISVVCCLVGCLITMPVLFPINATGGGTKTEFELLTMANVTNNYFKLFAHAICAIIFFSFVIYMITRETIYYINLRQAYLMSPYYTSRLSSKVVLYTSVPQDYMSETKLRAMLGPVVRRVWLATDTKKLDELIKDRDDAANKLEGAETKLIKTAYGNKLKAEKKAAKGGERSGSDEAAIADTESGTIAARYLQPKQRPSHKLKPIIGQKVDTIDWCRGELKRLIPEAAKMQASHKNRDAKMLGSAFVEFETVSDAQAAYQSLTHHQILHMSPRYTGMTPPEVIWSNLNIKWWERVVRTIVTTAMVVTLVIFWAVPVAFVGAISHVDKIIKLVPQLAFIENIPPFLLGIINGVLPTVLLAVLMALLPIFLRLMAKFSGDPTLSAVELTVQNSYFAFQIIQVFLVATIGAAATSVVEEVTENPANVVGLLANNIPTASTFYLSYFTLQGLSVVGATLFNIAALLVFKILGKFLDNTPRKMYNRWITLAGIGWGTLFPIYTNLFVIAICYAAIAPMVLIFAAVGLYLFYFAYRYNMMFVMDANIDTKGRIYPRALQQLFCGLYVAEVCLIGLFAISSGQSNMQRSDGVPAEEGDTLTNVYSRGALGPLVLMIIMLVFTALYHINFNSAVGPHLEALPKSVAAEEQRLMEAEHGEGYGHQKEADSERVAANGNGAPLDAPAPHKRPNLFTKWLRPDIYTDYETLRRIVPRRQEAQMSEETEANAYFNPSITSEPSLLWIPRDPLGISAEEVRDTSRVIPITDQGAHLNEKNNIVWREHSDQDDQTEEQPPIYQEKIYY